MNRTTEKALFATTLVVMMLLLAACMSTSPAVESPLARPSPLERPEQAASSEETLTANAQADLAERLGVSPDEIAVVSVEAVEWGDSSLGCPQEGMMYAQVITPGYRIVLAYGGGTYAYHTAAQADSPVIYCPEDEASSAPAEETQPAESATPDALIEAITADLAEQLGASPAEIEVASTEIVEWPDSSLGCPQEGMMYMPVVTPGYRIVLGYEDATYVYHTGEDADSPFVLCPDDEGAPAPAADMGGESIQSTSAALAARAMADLARRLDMDADKIEVVSVRAVEWRDGGLGCGQAGRMVPQVITPGYLIVLSADGVQYEYHTDDRAGGLVKFCGQAKKNKGKSTSASQ